MLLDQLLLVVAVCALGGAASRVAARIQGSGSEGIERVLVAAPLAAGFAVCFTLALGVAGLAGSPVALAAGPIIAWAGVRRLLPDSGPSLVAALIEAWDGASRGQRAAVLALAGAAAGCVVEIAREPGFDIDPLSYHLAEVVDWLHSGHAGHVQAFSYDLPFGYYPVTGEILFTWGLGISRSFAPFALYDPATFVLALLALWRLLRLLRVPVAVAAGALAAFATLPILVVGLNANGPDTDLPALAWLACTAALVARAPARPALLGPALLAAGLGIGTKTTVAPLAAVLLLWGVWRVRGRLRPARWWLAGGAVGAVLVGAPWYVRNTLTHGWPLWPFSSGPTGDPLPHLVSISYQSFLSRPSATVKAIGSGYRDWIAGGLGLAAGTLVISLIARARGALLAAAVAVASLLMWAAAPFTGVGRYPLLWDLTLSTVRYLGPALGACVVALALAARDAPPVGRRSVIALFSAATVASVISDLNFGFPILPSAGYLLIGAAAGALLGAVAPEGPLPVRGWRVGLSTAVPVLAVVFLALSAPGWLWRESRTHSYNHRVLAFMMSQRRFVTGSQPISFAPQVLASLAGPRLSHPIELIPALEPCPAVKARLERGWVVVWPAMYAPGVTSIFDAGNCLQDNHPIYAYEGLVVYGPSG